MAETKTVRPIAMGVGAIRIADVGDGVPGTDFTTLPLPTKSSVAFNFADPKEVKIDIEGSTEPLYVEFVKDTTDYIEFSIPTPSNDTIALLAGGTVDKGEELSPRMFGISLRIFRQSIRHSNAKHCPKKERK